MFEDPHYQARGLFEEVRVGEGSLKIPALVPKLSATPGQTHWAGTAVGAFNDAVYGELLGLSSNQLEVLRQQGVI